jgi:hypothetical protein
VNHAPSGRIPDAPDFIRDSPLRSFCQSSSPWRSSWSSSSRPQRRLASRFRFVAWPRRRVDRTRSEPPRRPRDTARTDKFHSKLSGLDSSVTRITGLRADLRHNKSIRCETITSNGPPGRQPRGYHHAQPHHHRLRPHRSVQRERRSCRVRSVTACGSDNPRSSSTGADRRCLSGASPHALIHGSTCGSIPHRGANKPVTPCSQRAADHWLRGPYRARFRCGLRHHCSTSSRRAHRWN